MATNGSKFRAKTPKIRRTVGGSRRERGASPSNRKKNQKMSEHEVVAFLGRKIANAMNDEDGDISKVRKENLSYYLGDEYGNEREGYSKFVTREVLETVEWVLPSVLRVFLSGDQIVTFDPSTPNDEESAKQETDVTNHYVMKANKDGEGGFLTLHHWMKDALMYPNAYIKAYMDEKTRTDVGIVSGLTEMGVQMIVNDDDVEIIEQRTREIEVMPPAQPGAMQQHATVEVYDLKIRTTKKVMELRIDAMPGEEVLVDKNCPSINLDEADFVCHRQKKSITTLVNEGYDLEELRAVGEGDNYDWNDERVNRLFYSDENPDSDDEDDDSMKELWVHECYAYFDFEGTGVAQFRQAVLIGDQLFDNEETNYQPIIALSAVLMQHKHTGMSYIDIVKDLQLLTSELTRQLLDNVYKINVRRKVFSEDALIEDGSTMEAILNTQAEFIPVRGAAQNAFVPEPTQSIIGELLPVIQHVETSRSGRTGVTPEAGVDPNALQEVRQEVFNNAVDRASQRIEMLVRIFAETGYRYLMLKVHQLLRSHWDVEKMVQLRGKWVEVDPQGWRNRTDMTVNVGLGFNTKPQQLAMLSSLLTTQKESASYGLTDAKKVYATLEKMINAGGVGDVRQFFLDPSDPDWQPPEPQPDPNMILAQAQAQALTQEQDRKMQEFHAKAQMDQQKASQEQQKGMFDAQTKAEEIGLRKTEHSIRLRELALKEEELIRAGTLKEGEINARIANIEADTELKKSNSDKAMAEATQKAIEAGDTYRQALDIVSKSGELNDERGTETDNTGEEDGEEEDGGDETADS